MSAPLNLAFIQKHETGHSEASINPLSHILMLMEISSGFKRTLTSKCIKFSKSSTYRISISSLF
jgi:hypothetical protein